MTLDNPKYRDSDCAFHGNNWKIKILTLFWLWKLCLEVWLHTARYNGQLQFYFLISKISIFISDIPGPSSVLISNFLQEIILVDDFNADPTIGEELEEIEKVKLIRNTERQGLIRSRSSGVKLAQGQTVLFLDSHCEVEPGWLEPLLQRVQDNPRAIVSPVIENINFETFKVNLKELHITPFWFISGE